MSAPVTAFPSEALPALLAVSLTAIHVVRAVYAADGVHIADFSFDYLNPAGQRMLGLPERPGGTARTHFPHPVATGLCEFYRQAFETGELLTHQATYQRDGLDQHYRFQAQRSGEWLVVSFIATSDQPYSEVEQALRDSPAREHARAQQLAEQQRLLQQILGQVPAAIATLSGPEHRFSFFNDDYQVIVAGRAHLGQPLAEAVPEVVEQGFVDLLDQVLATGEPFVSRAVPAQLHEPATGQLVLHYVDLSYQALVDEQNQRTGILAFVVDVTAGVLAQQRTEALQAEVLAAAQREAQQRQDLLQLFQPAPVAVALLREPDHCLDYFNDLFGQLFPGARAGRTMAETYLDPALAELIGRLDEVYEHGELYQAAEVQLPATPDQAPRYVSVTYQAYREHGRIAGVAVFAHEVTEQVLARRQRDAQRQELQRVLEQAPVAITVLRGPELVIEAANAAMSRLWGRPASHTVGRPHFEALPETVDQGFQELLLQVLTTGQSVNIVEAPALLARQGAGPAEQAYVNFTFQPLADERGATTGVIAVGAEVTEQVLARQQVEHLNQELATSNADLLASNTQLTRTNHDLDTFVYTASHDLKSPISNIEGLLEALREHLPAARPPDELVEQLLNMMDGAVGRFMQTLGHLTDVGHLQHTSLTAERAEVDLGALLEDVQLDMQPELRAAGAQLTLDLTQAPAAVLVAPKVLRSVVYNLLSNAVKYRALDRPPVVLVRAAQAGPRLVLTVQDNGLGLTEAQQTRLFGLFQRLHTHVEGSGVGLFMVKRLVENAGGTIAISSQAGAGSTFTVTLPLGLPTT